VDGGLPGSTPIGGPIAGVVSQHLGGRAGLALGAVTCFVAAGMGLLLLRRRPPEGDGTARTGTGVADPQAA
jgi:hypothetical protein